MSGGGSLTHPSTPARTARVADEPTQPIFDDEPPEDMAPPQPIIDDEPPEDIAPHHTPGRTARHCARANVFFSRTPQRAHASLFELWGCA
jgi:phage terminase large subunit-like protein